MDDEGNAVPRVRLIPLLWCSALMAAARARPASHPSRRKEIAAPEPQGYLSTPAALNGAEAACYYEPFRSGAITPGITRRPASLQVDDKRRVGGRVHAVVRRGIEVIDRVVIKSLLRMPCLHNNLPGGYCEIT
jgi:hypothetical protein